MAVIYTLMGIVYTPVIDPVRGIVLRKAARKRAASPGQMSLFGSNEPKQGDTKVVDGVTYQLNQHSRWEKTDKAKGKPKAVVPVVEDKAEKTPPTETEVKPEENPKRYTEDDLVIWMKYNPPRPAELLGYGLRDKLTGQQLGLFGSYQEALKAQNS